VKVPEMGLKTHLGLEAGAAAGADMFRLHLTVGISVDKSLVHGPTNLSIKGTPTSGVTTPVIHDPKLLGSTKVNEKNVSKNGTRLPHHSNLWT